MEVRHLLGAFNFDVIYEPGSITPSDYGSRHSPPAKQYSLQERSELGIETEEEDAEILIARLDMVQDAVTLPMLEKYTATELKQVKADIKSGHLSAQTEEIVGGKGNFAQLSLNGEVIMRGERLYIPKKLRGGVLAAAHEGCPGRDAMLRQLRQDVWWPAMHTDVKDYVRSCWACAAAVPTTACPPMVIRDTPDKVWSKVQADFKGPIGGEYYFHVVIDEFSRWPEVAVVKSTNFKELKKVLDRSFSLMGIPDQVTHDNGPPYNSQEWRTYAKEKGFALNPCTPEHPQSNGIAERFMAVLVKTVHAAIAKGVDPKVEVERRLLNYRNTPHPSTGKTPSQLIMNRKIKTKIPAIIKGSSSKDHQEATKANKAAKLVEKETYDRRKKVQEQEIKPGDKILIKQQKSTIKSPFDPKPFEVTKVIGNEVTATREGKMKVRNKSKVKLLVERPEHLRQSPKRSAIKESDDDDESFINLSAPAPSADRDRAVQAGTAGVEGGRQNKNTRVKGQMVVQTPGLMTQRGWRREKWVTD